jgi:photosystem II stability/assembly factor-like uncharacterized protein
MLSSMRRLLLISLFFLTTAAHPQWDIQSSGTTADLRGIDSLGKGIAWASGSNGTVLRTEDGGYLWQHCTTPPNAEHLDFRGIQAFDANTAIVMSSGKGDASRLYQTTDGCQTWVLIATNPDPDGFWDAAILMRQVRPKKKGTLYLLGDPVRGRFILLRLPAPLSPGEKLTQWKLDGTGAPKARDGESAFAASNSALLVGYVSSGIAFGTGGGTDSHWYKGDARVGGEGFAWYSSVVPIGDGSPSSGMFSVAFRLAHDTFHWWNVMTPGVNTDHAIGVAVGGDFQKPDDGSASAAYTSSGGQHWDPSFPGAMPHGYRSAVAYDPATKTWITVGSNGTDISTDDGRNWRALQPLPGEAPDADQHWNALSLPFAAGPHGRIGLLNPTALKPAK